MKYLTDYHYWLETKFESPFWDFIDNPDNDDIVRSIANKRMESEIECSYPLESLNFAMQYLLSIQYGLPLLICNNKVYSSWLLRIITQIVNIFSTKIPYMSLDMITFLKIILWEMTHKYYSTWNEWYKVWELINEYNEGEILDDNGDLDKLDITISTLIPLYTKVTSKKYINWTTYLSDFFTKNRIQSQENWDYDKAIEASFNLCIHHDLDLKFSNDGLKYALKMLGKRTDLVQWLKQFRIKRSFKMMPLYILISILTVINWWPELYLCYDPLLLKLTICDKDNIEIDNDRIIQVINFSKIVRSVFEWDIIVKNKWKWYIYEVINKDSKLSPEDFKQLFDELYEHIKNLSPNDLTITAEWKIDDNNRFNEINDSIEFWEVWFIKHKWEKKWIKFKVKKQLKPKSKK